MRLHGCKEKKPQRAGGERCSSSYRAREALNSIPSTTHTHTHTHTHTITEKSGIKMETVTLSSEITRSPQKGREEKETQASGKPLDQLLKPWNIVVPVSQTCNPSYMGG
jgi:hypothetical protein